MSAGFAPKLNRHSLSLVMRSSIIRRSVMSLTKEMTAGLPLKMNTRLLISTRIRCPSLVTWVCSKRTFLPKSSFCVIEATSTPESGASISDGVMSSNSSRVYPNRRQATSLTSIKVPLVSSVSTQCTSSASVMLLNSACKRSA